MPGRVEAPSDAVLSAWNRLLCRAFESFARSSRFTVHGGALREATTHTIRWLTSPAEAERHLGRDTTRTLCDWDWRGRSALHQEFAEYAVSYRYDAQGRRRPKRVEVTTELHEYWVLLAELDPERLLASAFEVLREPVSWADLYGPGVRSPLTLSSGERRARFLWYTAGEGDRERAHEAPAGRLNRERALFMTHPSNRLEDLAWLLSLGARPWSVREASGSRDATLGEIAASHGASHVLHRRADPLLIADTCRLVREGRRVSLQNPPGVYVQRFSRAPFRLAAGDAALPDAWVRYERGGQRLVFGPPDDDPRFLDDITVDRDGGRHALRGGHDVLDALEVGVELVAGAPEALTDDERASARIDPDAIPAAPAEPHPRALALQRLKHQYDESQEPVARGRR